MIIIDSSRVRMSSFTFLLKLCREIQTEKVEAMSGREIRVSKEAKKISGHEEEQ